MIENKKSISLFDLLAIFVSIVSAISLILLSLNKFNPKLSILSGLIFISIYLLVIKPSINRTLNKKTVFLLIILLIALIFRFKPYLFILGGQDEGTYVNMSAYFENYGTTLPVDTLRQKLSSIDQLDYDKQTLALKLPAVYPKDLSKSQYEFQFFPLHPIWLSIFGGLFGTENRIYSLTFFSIFGLYLFYQLILQVFGEKYYKAALLAVFLLAINPVHAYFSKFPVSEIPLLFFNVAGFYYLVKFLKNLDAKRINPTYPILAVFLFLCSFFTHISGLMYLPFLYLIFVYAIFNNKHIKEVFLCFYSLFAMFSLSVLFGYIYVYNYTDYNFGSFFGNYFGENWNIGVLFIAFLLFLFPFVLKHFRNQFKQIASFATVLFIKYMLVIFITITLIALYKTYNLAFTDQYSNPAYNTVNWQMANKGIQSIKFSNLFVLTLNLSPIVILIIPFAMHKLKKLNRNVVFLLAFGLQFYFLKTVMIFVTPYQYYFSRYLLSEVIPVFIIIISVYLWILFQKHKIISLIIILVVSSYSLYFTIGQFDKYEGWGVYSSLLPIKNTITKKDLLIINDNRIFIVSPQRNLLYQHYYLGEISSTLTFFFNLNCLKVNITHPENQRPYLTKIIDSYTNIYLISSNGEKINSPYAHLLKVINFKNGSYEQVQRIPTKYEISENEIYFYAIDKEFFRFKQN